MVVGSVNGVVSAYTKSLVKLTGNKGFFTRRETDGDVEAHDLPITGLAVCPANLSSSSSSSSESSTISFITVSADSKCNIFSLSPPVSKSKREASGGRALSSFLAYFILLFAILVAIYLKMLADTNCQAYVDSGRHVAAFQCAVTIMAKTITSKGEGEGSNVLDRLVLQVVKAVKGAANA